MGKMIGGNSASASCSYDRKAVQMGFGSENTINDTVTNSSHNVSHSNGRMCVSALSPEAACRLWHCKWPATRYRTLEQLLNRILDYCSVVGSSPSTTSPPFHLISDRDKPSQRARD
ncbi:hypothetical protein FOQG_10675 [Fusarium oxysporum f. sp. raphani 54005]|uniref:Uncharacterized protein n=2 Tax=Fusarium oxysporum TaxID=5507 RepID=X0BT21_FUSOX|nr:hypothetical protein FOVG_00060 [Fusarium oxysporum f. sp. pisi HDV247]EXK85315.1 hypothetical protein FOQG_10675 [Fusarium oxysporum f. sp. raphani 54005]